MIGAVADELEHVDPLRRINLAFPAVIGIRKKITERVSRQAQQKTR
jgi:hypothetical protein